jgi:trimeric autotransporter adhesin
MSVKIQFKRTTASAWTSLNPTLSAGEVGYETDTGKYKIGNGATAWTSLAYAVTANLAFATLNDLGDVTITSAADGDFLRWNGTAWINDAVNLSTDTIGSYVESLVAGTGVTLSDNSGEGATPTVAVDTSIIQARVADVSDTEIGYLNGVTSAIQTQIDTKAPIASPTFTGTVTLPDNTVALGTKTTGDYVATITGGTGVASTAATSGEGTTHTLSIGQAVGTSDNVTFAGVTADAITIGVTAAGEIDTTSGNLTIDSAGGTVTIDDNLTVTGNLVTGNLTVSGTTTSINTETLTVDDNIIVLNNNVTSTPSENAGIEVERGTSANVSVRWNETSDKWEVTNDGTNYGDIVSTYDTGTVSTAMIASDAVTTNKINDGAVTNAKVSATAAIVDTKLATISTAGKVSNSATTATNLDVANAIVARDANGAFSAGSITASLNGNANSATVLQTSRNIAGQAFNGSANISIAPTDLTGVTSTASEINVLDGITSSTAELNILDGVTADASELNILDGATLTTTELNYVDGVTSGIQAQIDLKAPLANPTFTGTVAGITSTMVGLGNVDNTSDANKPISTATQTALDLKAPSANPTFTGTVSGVTATHVGLGSVNNTSDADKPISTATQTALDLKANLASPTFTGTPTLPTGTVAFTQTLGDNTTAVATTAFIQTALANFGGMTVSDTVPASGDSGDFWWDSTGLNLYIYYSDNWVQVSSEDPVFFELSELLGVEIGNDLLPNHTLRFDGPTGNWVNSAPRQNVGTITTTSYSVSASDSGKVLLFNNASAISVDLGSWGASVGEKVDIVRYGTGQVTVTVSGSVTTLSPGNSVTTRAQYSLITATCVASNTFLLSGDLT